MLQEYDAITHVDGDLIDGPGELKEKLSEMKLGTEYTIRVQRLLPKTPKWRPKTVKLTPSTKGKVALSVMKRTVDPVSRATTLVHKDDPVLGTHVSAIVVKINDDAQPAGFLSFHFEGPDWLFIETITVRVGDESWTLTPDDVVRNNSVGTVWESCTFRMEGDAMDAMKHLSEIPKGAVVRFGGSKGNHDHTITEEEAERLQMTLLAMMASK